MKLHSIETGHFKLDGGAMFGVVPKSLWQRTNPADTNNLIDMAATSLLIEDGDRLILIDTGLGNKQSEKFFSHYHRWGNHSLEKSLKNKGFHPNDITDVFMTHLHFDHCGGCIQWNKDKTGYEPAFKNAKFWTNKEHWKWATEPNAREKASFLKENLLPMQESGQLNFLERKGKRTFYKHFNFEVLFVDGHTDKQMLPIIDYQGKKIVFAADLLPTAGHVPLPYVMGYDTRPLLTLEEKKDFLKEAVDQNYFIFLEHDAHNEIIDLKMTEKGPRLNKVYTFDELFNE
ncbi:MBL fold metallo-hydrolase [Psychroflexus maritimus]|uniref:MBL fold metallo-hydrolase n=1 Tax=Psychroflexus maritimus TaxID=2714865 RepID=A0A967ABU4_9FLAO|nr:MBL fold metallo-hydrolase [Psychroflexus maritimus]NGZ89394.1 MBL fold metallo-hydrolase [Psychroflexus maritimus]